MGTGNSTLVLYKNSVLNHQTISQPHIEIFFPTILFLYLFFSSAWNKVSVTEVFLFVALNNFFSVPGKLVKSSAKCKNSS